MPPNRLVTLLQQAVAYQVEFNRYHPKVTPLVGSLFRDFRCTAVPNTCRDSYAGHSLGARCVCFVGSEGLLLASGGGEGGVHVWSANPGNGTMSESGGSCGEGVEQEAEAREEEEEEQGMERERDRLEGQGASGGSDTII
ncbi:unnamed protein product, partial [Choristocarpus tenellus]